MPDRLWDWRRIGRLITLAFGLAMVAPAVMVIPPWVVFFLTTPLVHRLMRQLTLGLLIGLEFAYGVILVGSLIGAIVLSGILWRARRGGASRPRVARGLLLCGSCLVGLALAEAIAATWGAPLRSLPAARAREPDLPSQSAERDDGEVTLVVVGESSAAGSPFEQWLSIGEIVAWQLAEAIPGSRFRALVVADPGDTLETQYHKLAELRRRPDAVIVYCGHNEFFARIPWSRQVPYYRDDKPLVLKSIDQVAQGATPVCSLIQRAADKYRIEILPPSWFQPSLVDAPAYTPAEFAAILADFHRRLEAISEFAERVGALLILVIPPGNDAGFEPSRSFLRADTPRPKRETFALDFRAARRLEASDPALSISQYRALLARQPRFAESHYRLARLLEKTGMWDEAYEQYIAARDLDGLPMRCLSALQQVYVDVAESHKCILVDGQALFHAIGPHGLLDDTLFNDVMHPSLRGHIALATAVLDALRERGKFGWPRGMPTPTIDPARCAAHFGLHSRGWLAVCHWGQIFYGTAASLRYDPTQCRAKEAAYKDAIERINAGEPPESLGLPNVGIPVALPASAVRRSEPRIPDRQARPVG